ncbi:Calcium-binding protein p22 [Heterocephalus glaber]|uniref:Calcium-binding protein p22 n=1 Tax=Heterocephalus glaber TaxID=10181 RepID=G5BF98_HETGA|nr:Calcium-binding protein p22 [Heterocephalus glaber]
MESRAFTLLRDEELEEIKKETCFSHSQITGLYSQFTSLDKGENGTFSREDFQRIPELAINPLREQIINAFFPEGDDQVNFRWFMRILAHFRPIEDNEKSKDVNGPEPLNSRSNKLHFAFRLYDLDKDDNISRDELLQVLRMMVGVNISDEQLGSIVDRTIQEADRDGDSAISFTVCQGFGEGGCRTENEHPVSSLKGTDQTIPCCLVFKNWNFKSPPVHPSHPYPISSLLSKYHCCCMMTPNVCPSRPTLRINLPYRRVHLASFCSVAVHHLFISQHHLSFLCCKTPPIHLL